MDADDRGRGRHTIDITADPAQPILPLLMSTVTVVPAETPMDSVRRPADRHRALHLRRVQRRAEHQAVGKSRLLGRAAGGAVGNLRLPLGKRGARGDGRDGRGGHRAEHRGAGCDEPRHGLLVPELRDRLPAGRHHHCAARRRAGAQGAELRGGPRSVRRHDPGRGHASGDRHDAAVDAGLQRGARGRIPSIPRRRRRCSRRPRPTACPSTPRSR